MKKLLIFLFSAFFFSMVFAVPADPTPRTVPTKDGRTLTYICQGDEFLQVYKTLDYYTILKTEEYGWVYAIQDGDGNLISSNIIASNEDQRSAEENTFLSVIPKNLFYKTEQISPQIENRMNISRPMRAFDSQTKSTKISLNTFPTEGTVNLLLILVEFQDVKMKSTHTREKFQDLASGENYKGNSNGTGKMGSIREYYLENSNGKLDLNIDVVGPYTVSKKLQYYGQNLYQTILGEKVRLRDFNPEGMVDEAIRLAMADNVDFTKYDNDNDGVIDAIHVIYAGRSEASTFEENDLWPMRSEFSQYHQIQAPTPNGKKTNVFSISSEYQGKDPYMAGIGPTCHELTHVLGLPDWYDTDTKDGKNYVMGEYSLMDMGPYLNKENTPPHLNAIEKEMLNWHNHIELDTAGVYTLPVWNADGNAISYKLTTPVEHEYFIIENRQKKGWDQDIPGYGMLIYHVDQKMVNVWYEGPDAIRNSINARKDSMGCYLICADNERSSGHSSMQRDPFGGLSYNTSFTDESSPASKLRYTNGPLNKPITNITRLSNSTIQFTYNYNTVSLATIAPCSDNVKDIAPLVAGTYNAEDTYQWQILSDGEWKNAPGISTNSEYYLTEYKTGSNFRRILYPAADPNLELDPDPDTSNVYVLPEYKPAIGGNITPESEIVTGIQSLNFTLNNYSGNIVDWEMIRKDKDEWESLNRIDEDLDIKLEKNGDYLIRAAVRQGKCPVVYSSEASIIVTGALNIDDVDNTAKAIYFFSPNPSDGLVNIYSPNNDPYDINIFSTSGKLVFVKNEIGLRETSINLSDLQTGIYIIQFKNRRDNSVYNGKLILK